MKTENSHNPAKVAFIVAILCFTYFLDPQHSVRGQGQLLSEWINVYENLKQTREDLRALSRVRQEEIQKLAVALKKKKSELEGIQLSIGYYDLAIQKIERARISYRH